MAPQTSPAVAGTRHTAAPSPADDYGQADYGGDGYAGAPVTPTLAPGSGDGAGTTSAPVLAAATATVFDALRVVLLEVASGVQPSATPAELQHLFAVAQGDANADDFRALATEALTMAVGQKPAIDAVAAYLAPLAAPYKGNLDMVSGLPKTAVVPFVLKQFGLAVPEGGKRYLGDLFGAITARL